MVDASQTVISYSVSLNSQVRIPITVQGKSATKIKNDKIKKIAIKLDFKMTVI